MVDKLTPAQRSWNMSRIRGMNTSPERMVRRCAYRRGLRYFVHVMSLPGRPDMVFAAARVAVFIDGDFWHGWRFPSWCARLSPYWHEKIARNRRRDRKNFQRLRRAGWSVVRIWEHDVVRDAEACVDRILTVVKEQKAPRRIAVRGGTPKRAPRSTR
jgi:DNA mismatch endonuclease (patch repair protein)